MTHGVTFPQIYTTRNDYIGGYTEFVQVVKTLF